jgi:glutamate 5-kinase
MAIKSFNTIVIKVGSSSLSGPQGKLDVPNLQRIVSEVADLVKNGKRVILVSSGAIVCGAERMGLGKPKTIPEKQAAAAVGQSRLMRQYEKAFEEFELTVAQVLLTRDAIADRERYLNARHTLDTLLEQQVIPIVNENDTVAIDEIKVGDNDNLAALTSSLMGADLLVILTDVEGFYMKNEEGVPYPVPEIREITAEVKDAAGHPSSQLGTGGMITKLQAAEICSYAGTHMAIIHGRKDGLISKVVNGEKVGTLFIPKSDKTESRKRWLAHGLPIEGTITVDSGAETALLKKGTSLLPVGIRSIKGTFRAESLVSVVNENGQELARGLVNIPSEELQKLIGKKDVGEAIHRDDLVIL